MVPNRVLLLNGILVMPDRLVEGGVLVESGRIASIHTETRELPDAPLTIDLNGGHLAPGFIDLHVHGACGVDLMSAGTEDLNRLAKFLLHNGVTRFLPTTVPSSDSAYLQALETSASLMRVQSKEPGRAHVLGIHFEGPFLNPNRPGALNAGQLRSYRERSDISLFLSKAIREPGGKVMMTLAPEVEGGLELVKELYRSGIVVSIGHSQATFEICEAAFERGARHITHFPNALSPLHHREPGVLGWGLLRHEVTVDLIADGLHVERQMVRLVHKNKSSERMGLISDAIAPCGLGDGDYQVWGESIQVRGGKTSNAAGNLAGSVITLREAVANLLNWGFPMTEISQMASQVPAKVLGIADDVGRLEVGKRADLVVLDQEMQVPLAMVDGHITQFERPLEGGPPP